LITVMFLRGYPMLTLKPPKFGTGDNRQLIRKIIEYSVG
jgi:hypothetical protein